MAFNSSSIQPLNFSASGGVFKVNGQRVYIKGANWFGLETTDWCLHGLWSVSADSIISFLKTYKFNAVRLPISVEAVENLDRLMPQSLNTQANPDLAGLNMGQFIERILAKFAAAGILVMIDMHMLSALIPSQKTPIPELWYSSTYPEARSIAAWMTFLDRYANKYWNIFACDLKNEPHGRATWGDGNTETDWAAAAERMGNAILSRYQRMLIFVEGIEGRDKADSWWGGYFGFIRHNTRPLKLTVPDRLVYSPHVYGPSVWPKSMFAGDEFPFNMPPQWEEQWAWLKKNPANPPLCIGEWGGRAVDTVKGAEIRKDLTWQRALSEYLVMNDIRDTFYWCINPNSGDTQGLLKDDWVSPEPLKLQHIAHVCPNPTSFLGGKANTPSTPAPLRPWTSVIAGVKPMLPAATSNIAPADDKINARPTPVADAAPVPGHDPSSCNIEPTGPATAGRVSLTVKNVNKWVESGAMVYRCDITITNPAGGGLLGAKFRIQETDPTSNVTQLWSMTKVGNLWGLPNNLIDQGGLGSGKAHTFGCVSKNAMPKFAIVARG